MAKQLEMMYEGKAKQVFATDDPTLAVIHYKDDATAFNRYMISKGYDSRLRTGDFKIRSGASYDEILKVLAP